MAKTKSVFFCSQCGAQSPKWIGHCPSCGEWNTYQEEVIHKEKPAEAHLQWTRKPGSGRAWPVKDVEAGEQQRMFSGDSELDRVLGGGIVQGSLVLIGGEPGIGKSTLMLQAALRMNKRVLYVSGEESGQQIRMRADRIGIMNEGCYVFTETGTADIFAQLAELKPDLVIIDSIQTLQTVTIDSSAGSISQIRECASEFQRYAKQTGTPVFLIGHITKDGSIAGPKVLEHMVDTVLQFEGDRNHVFRILRSVKNRFGPAAELGIYEMQSNGLREVENPSEVLITHQEEEVSGVAIAAIVEGLRPMLIEVQALASTAAYGTPQRSATGFDLRRMNMLLAVLEKRCGFKLGSKDVFLNMAGGIRVDDPATDLAVVCAVLSSSTDLPLQPKSCFSAEVGLAGEIRPVGRIEQRITEAAKLGFRQIIISRHNLKGLDPKRFAIEIKAAARVEEVFSQLFG